MTIKLLILVAFVAACRKGGANWTPGHEVCERQLGPGATCAGQGNQLYRCVLAGQRYECVLDRDGDVAACAPIHVLPAER